MTSPSRPRRHRTPQPHPAGDPLPGDPLAEPTPATPHSADPGGTQPRVCRRYRRAALWAATFDGLGVALLGATAFIAIVVVGALIQTGSGLTSGLTDLGDLTSRALALPFTTILAAMAPWLLLLWAAVTAATNLLLVLMRALWPRFATWNTGAQGYVASTLTWLTLAIAGLIATQFIAVAVGDIASTVFADQITDLRKSVTGSEVSQNLLGDLTDLLTGLLSDRVGGNLDDPYGHLEDW